MMNQMVVRLKRVVAATLIATMLMGLGMVANAADEDATNFGEVKYEQVKKTVFDECYETKAPAALNEDCGYLFAGWFTKEGSVYKPIESAGQTVTGGYYAKYIPAQMLRVKLQNWKGTEAGTQQTHMRILTAVDSLNYKNVGFKLSVVTLGSEKTTYESERVLSTGSDVAKVYLYVRVNNELKTPQGVFGVTKAKYFATTTVNNITNSNFGAIICVTPYIETLDGVTVDGLTEYAHVEDGYSIAGYKWINVPINVRDTKDVAAGVLQLAQNTGDMTVTDVQIECGKLFQEMDFAQQTGAAVKVVGNLKDMSANTKANTIFANVRFKVAEGTTLTADQSLFNVTGEDFADIYETQYTDSNFPVWNVYY